MPGDTQTRWPQGSGKAQWILQSLDQGSAALCATMHRPGKPNISMARMGLSAVSLGCFHTWINWRCCSETRWCFPLWLALFGHMWTQQCHCGVEQNNSAEISWKRWSWIDSVRLQSKHHRPSQRNKQRWYVPPGNRRQKDPLTKMANVVLYLYVYCCFPAKQISRSVCGIQHLGNMLIWPNVDAEFHLLTAPR